MRDSCSSIEVEGGWCTAVRRWAAGSRPASDYNFEMDHYMQASTPANIGGDISELFRSALPRLASTACISEPNIKAFLFLAH